MILSNKVYLTSVCAILLIVSATTAEWFELSPNSQVCPPAVTVRNSDDLRTVIEINLSGFELDMVTAEGQTCHTIRMPDCSSISVDGTFDVPIITKIVAIPGDVNVTVTISEVESIILTDIRPRLPEKNMFRSEEETQLESDYRPKEVVEVGSPAILRDVRVVPLVVHPMRYDSAKKELLVYRRICLDLQYSGRSRTNVKSKIRNPSDAFRAIYKSLILNYDHLDFNDANYRRGSYLIITHDTFFEHIQPLAEWKHRQGWSTRVVTLSDIGPNPSKSDIRNYILQAYMNWEAPPEYILLVGDTHIQGIGEFPSFYKQPPDGSDSDVTDHPYSLIEGDDYFPDLFVGRLSVDTINDLVVTVNKILKYEREPYKGQTDWYKSALLVAGNYAETPPIPTTPRLTTLWLREKMLAQGYGRIDTVFYPPNTGPQLISASINRGVGMVNYRGWGDANGWHYPNFKVDDILSLNNGLMLPVMASFVCNSGDFGNQDVDPCFGEAWLRAGTVFSPKGGAAFYGPSDLHTSTKFNNAINAGMYWGMFNENMYSLGAAALRGKFELYLGFPNLAEPDDWVEFYFHVYNILGDPGLDIWTDIPQSLTVSHPPDMFIGENAFEVTVQKNEAEPAEGASVCLFKGDEVFCHGFTDKNGIIDFLIQPATEGTLHVTVTRHNHFPYKGTAVISESRSYIGYYGHDIDDSQYGNGDGQPNAQEGIRLPITVKNFGTNHIAIAVTGTLKTVDPNITISDSIATFDNIAPADSSTDMNGFLFQIHPNLANGYPMRFNLIMKDDLGVYYSEFEISVVGPDIVYLKHEIDDGDGNGLLDPGESAYMVTTLSNVGLQNTWVQAILRSTSDAVIVIDSIGHIPEIPVEQSDDNYSDPFIVNVAPSVAVGRLVSFQLYMTGENHFRDTTSFSLIIGEVTSTDPLGPDSYGYYAYDNTDIPYSEAPFYNWIEIDPDYGGNGRKFIMGDDDIMAIDLPFLFRYYGIDYDRMSICSNGWLAMGETWMNDFRNWGIPAALGPYAMIAPFWDDLDSTFVSEIVQDEVHICYWHDVSDHRLIVEWSRVLNHYDSSLEVLQAILHDPQYFPTLTGDGEIVFQYHTVNNGDARSNYATVGIESPSQAEGLEYTYANRYPPAAAPLTAGLAIKFTTDPPDTFKTSAEGGFSTLFPSSHHLLHTYPNPFNPSTTIQYTLPSEEGRTDQWTSSGQENGGRIIPLHVTVRIYNILGEEVRLLVNELKTPGIYTVSWDGRDVKGKEVTSGLYFCQFEWGDARETKRMLLIK